ncbi:MAG TPA: helix-turn-helix domain-containing protein [Candidatus Aerophobetes bacterium]|uniref:Helix-turn-helix domain-containing protein n=1 Tax=Aerophobetes bacterium TaxID=2030807 RepID=A0A7V0N1N1_UNCAE|nr:helix-turn-helix domain-containing protein [Candidatus Aerophobetes bacterium]
MAEIGEKLRQKREELGYDYDYIFQKTKIHPKILKALEDEDFEYFSSEVYLKSFLKKYAQFLNLDFNSLIKDLNFSEIAEGKSLRLPPSITPSLLGFSQKFYLGLKFLLLFIAVVISIYLVFMIIDKLSSKFISHKKYRKETIRQVEVVPEPVVKPSLSPEISLTGLSQQSKGEVNEPLKLTLVAKDDCWLQLRADGEKIYEGILKKGQRETWSAKKEFELWVGAASRLKVYLNGKDLGSLGRGVIKGIKITSRGLKLP